MTTHEDALLCEKIVRYLKKYPNSSLENLVRAAYEKQFHIDPSGRMRAAEIKAFEEEGVISAHLAAFIQDMKIPGEEK